MESEITKRVNKNGMIISRMPSWAKQVIYEKAELEHCCDYGACVAQLIREALEYQCLKEKFFNNDLDMNLTVNDKHNKEEVEETLKFANGREVKKQDGY